MQIRWTEKALDNLDAAVDYIAADNPVAAKKIAKKIWNSVQLLKTQPGIGRPGRVVGTRELIVIGLPYVVPYVEKHGVVIILRIMHSSIKWPGHF